MISRLFRILTILKDVNKRKEENLEYNEGNRESLQTGATGEETPGSHKETKETREEMKD